jgi:hypothetical protein
VAAEPVRMWTRQVPARSDRLNAGWAWAGGDGGEGHGRGDEHARPGIGPRTPREAADPRKCLTPIGHERPDPGSALDGCPGPPVTIAPHQRDSRGSGVSANGCLWSSSHWKITPEVLEFPARSGRVPRPRGLCRPLPDRTRRARPRRQQRLRRASG